MKNPFMISMVIVFMILFSACRQAGDRPAGSDGWLAGDIQQKFETIARQFAGFGKTMWETDYRYQELYWAGKDLNWEYAEHQIEELEETLEHGLERRPVRAASAQQFLTSALPELEKAVIARDPELFEKRFLNLMNTCNSCHALEEMPFITVKLPRERRSSIR
jgi:hypothetical protein